MQLRPFLPESSDTDNLYDICLRTADNGEDGSAHCTHPHLVGSYFAVPYAVVNPELVLILQDDEGPCGYVLGTADTRGFAAWFNRTWLPGIRERFGSLAPREDTFDGWLLDILDRDMIVPEFAGKYPAHLHIDLLPRAQGKGWGRRMVNAWAALAGKQGATGFHLGVSSANKNAVSFYRHIGLHELAAEEWGWFMGMKIP